MSTERVIVRPEALTRTPIRRVPRGSRAFGRTVTVPVSVLDARPTTRRPRISETTARQRTVQQGEVSTYS